MGGDLVFLLRGSQCIIQSLTTVLLIVGGARGVMVILAGNGFGDDSWTRLIAFHIALIPLGKV